MREAIHYDPKPRGPNDYGWRVPSPVACTTACGLKTKRGRLWSTQVEGSVTCKRCLFAMTKAAKAASGG